jgi:hypothetical protein
MQNIHHDSPYRLIEATMCVVRATQLLGSALEDFGKGPERGELYASIYLHVKGHDTPDNAPGQNA